MRRPQATTRIVIRVAPDDSDNDPRRTGPGHDKPRLDCFIPASLEVGDIASLGSCESNADCLKVVLLSTVNHGVVLREGESGRGPELKEHGLLRGEAPLQVQHLPPSPLTRVANASSAPQPAAALVPSQ
jgi:hypothetical protein